MKFVKSVLGTASPTAPIENNDPETGEEFTLTEYLDTTLRSFQPARPYSTIHASMLTYEGKSFCPREVALCDVLGREPKPENIPSVLQATFDMGWAVHHLMSDKWLRNIAVGRWCCVQCHQITGFIKHPGKCPFCKANRLEYREEVFQHKSLLVSGSIDVIVNLNKEKHTIVEVKSIDKDQFKDLKAPLGEHRVRSMMYLDLVATSGNPIAGAIDTSEARILYVSKGYGAKTDGKITPFKEYRVPANPNALKPYYSKAAEVVKWRTEGILPKGVCPNSYSGRVKQCACAHECWSGQYMAGSKLS